MATGLENGELSPARILEFGACVNWGNDLSIPAFDAMERKGLVTLLAARIAQLPEVPKKVLPMYYYEGLRLADIAACFNLTELWICQIHTQAVNQLRTYLFSVLT